MTPKTRKVYSQVWGGSNFLLWISTCFITPGHLRKNYFKDKKWQLGWAPDLPDTVFLVDDI